MNGKTYQIVSQQVRSFIAPAILAARAHWPAILIVQTIGLALVVAYYNFSASRALFDQVAAFKLNAGLVFVALSTIFSGFFLPEVIKRFVRPTDLDPPGLLELLHQLVMWAWLGILVDRFYALQNVIFGQSGGLVTLVCKVMVDQFIFTPLVSLPLSVLWFMLFEARYRPRRFIQQFSIRALWERVSALWAICLCFWPIMLCIVYSLPVALQFPLFLVGNAAYSILMIFILRRTQEKS